MVMSGLLEAGSKRKLRPSPERDGAAVHLAPPGGWYSEAVAEGELKSARAVQLVDLARLPKGLCPSGGVRREEAMLVSGGCAVAAGGTR